MYINRCRNSRGENLDSVGVLTPPPTMDINCINNGNRGQRNCNNRENWGKMPEPQNGHAHQVIIISLIN